MHVLLVAELLAYAKDVVRTHRLEEDGVLRLHHRVVEARWQDDIQRWPFSMPWTTRLKQTHPSQAGQTHPRRPHMH
jgi:hypothetical protein